MVLRKYENVFTNELLQELLPRFKVDHKIEVILRFEPPSMAPLLVE